MALKASYSVYVNDTGLATEIEEYLNESEYSTSEAFRLAIIDKMEKDGHFENEDK